MLFKGKFTVGQNLGNGYASWTTCVQGWFDEIKDFKYNSSDMETDDSFKKIGHFTQVRND